MEFVSLWAFMGLKSGLPAHIHSQSVKFLRERVPRQHLSTDQRDYRQSLRTSFRERVKDVDFCVKPYRCLGSSQSHTNSCCGATLFSLYRLSGFVSPHKCVILGQS